MMGRGTYDILGDTGESEDQTGSDRDQKDSSDLHHGQL